MKSTLTTRLLSASLLATTLGLGALALPAAAKTNYFCTETPKLAVVPVVTLPTSDNFSVVLTALNQVQSTANALKKELLELRSVVLYAPNASLKSIYTQAEVAVQNDITNLQLAIGEANTVLGLSGSSTEQSQIADTLITAANDTGTANTAMAIGLPAATYACRPIITKK
jgi:hypothetical protein